MTLHDHFLPQYDFSEHHSISIHCSREKISEAVTTVDFRGSFIIRTLFFLRGISQKTASGVDGAKDMGFTVLRQSDEEIILGLVGQFWRPTGKIQRIEADAFKTFNDPAYARATWNFKIVGTQPPYILETETRIACPDPDTKRKFSRYWILVRPFSGLIRIEMLKAIRKKCV